MTSSAFAQSANVTIDEPKDPKEKPKDDSKKKDDKKADKKTPKPKVIIKKVDSKPKVIVKTVKIPSSTFTSNLLLLDSKQLCLIASDVQCVASQSHFMTSSLTTSYDSSSKSWDVSGNVKNVGKADLHNIVVTAILYDINGASVGSSIAATVSPSLIKSFEDGTFKMTVEGKGAMFIVLSYS